MNVVAYISSPFFLFLNNSSWNDMLRFVYPFISEKKFGCIHFVDIENNATINVCVHVFAWTCFHFSWAYM